MFCISELIPDEIGNLHELQSLVMSVNHLKSLPESCKNLSNLSVIKFDYNQMEDFPQSICSENLKTHLAEIHAKNNSIKDIPPSISALAALKILDLTENKIDQVPGELGDCNRLKEVYLKGNKLSDRKLLKLVEQAKMKQILDYIRSNCQKLNHKNGDVTKESSLAEAKARMREARRRRRSSSRSSIEEREASLDSVTILGLLKFFIRP